MFRNGIYRIDYRNPLDHEAPGDDALVVMRDGRMIGSDRYGGVFSGAARRSPLPPLGPKETIGVQMTVPPGGSLVTGHKAGPTGATIDILGRLDPALDHQTATIDVAGHPVELRVSYLGPLPR